MQYARIEFSSPDKVLNRGFAWAKVQAMSYVHEDWYEAALPARRAFCIRDICHMSAGAYFLGLKSHNYNMLYQFVKSISGDRDYCTYWEITGGDFKPAEVDYKDDSNFWYNLPANFDIMDCAYRMYILTANERYINSKVFRDFYSLSADEYIKAWDRNSDGIPDRDRPNVHRGIPSYDEKRSTERSQLGADLIAAQCAAFRALEKLDSSYSGEADRLKAMLNTDWWDADSGRFYGFMDMDGNYHMDDGSLHLLPYFDVIEGDERMEAVLARLERLGKRGTIVELLSHYPEIFFRCGKPKAGLDFLKRCVSPRLKRREYPELSFSVINAYVTGLMGITLNAPQKSVQVTDKNLPSGMNASISYVPFLGGYINVSYADGEATVENYTGTALTVNGKHISNEEAATL